MNETRVAETLCMYDDGEGLPRAWAVGPTDKLGEVRREARRQLEAYIEKRRTYGEVLMFGDFTFREEPVK